MNKISSQNQVKMHEEQVNLFAKELVQNQLSSWKKAACFWSAFFLIVMCLISALSMWYIADLGNDILLNLTEASQAFNGDTLQEETSKIAIKLERNNLLSADYLAVVLPLLIALAGSFIVFLGMNRLKMFDERIDKTRVDMLKELETMVKNQVISDRTQYAKEIEETIQKQSDQFIGMLNQFRDEFAQIKCKYIEEIELAGSEFSWLKESVKLEDVDLSIHSVIDAHNQVENLHTSRPTNYITLVKKIVDRVCDDNPLSGDSTDYHNLSAELARGSLYYEATKVLQRGISLVGDNPDLLADLIQYATQGGMLTVAKSAYEKLASIDRRLWTWRCYIFSSDYFLATGDVNTADKMCDNCIQFFPTDERGYSKKAHIAKQITSGMSGIRSCIYILESALNKNINCPQCATILAETYLELGEYQDALNAADRAILELAQEQPHVNVSHVFYTRATCYDRMFLHSIKKNMPDKSLAESAYLDYETALGFNRLSTAPSMQAVTRMKILSPYLPNNS